MHRKRRFLRAALSRGRAPLLIVAIVAISLRGTAAPLTRADGPADPFGFEPLAGQSTFPLQQLDHEHSQSFSFSPDGSYIALSRTPATIDVWSLRSGRRTISQTLGGPDRSTGYAALAGEPCSAIVGRDAHETSKATPLQAYSCETGALLATVPARQLPTGLMSLTPVQGCGLVVASYTGGAVVVYDTATRSLRPKLERLFYDTTPKLNKKPARYSERAQWVLAAPSPTGCIVNGILLQYHANAKQLMPAGLYEFDLRAEKAVSVKQLGYDRRIDAAQIMPIGRLVTSPSGDTAAFLFQRVTDFVFQNRGPPGTADLIVFDLKTGLPPKIVDVHRQGAIRNLAFLNEREIILTTWALDVGNIVSLFDVVSEKSHTLCDSDFTNWQNQGSTDQGPSAIGVDAKRNVLAVVFQKTVRIYRYGRDPARGYAGRRLCKGY